MIKKLLLIFLTVLLLSLFTYATRDVCWVGNGYGSCNKMIDEVTSHPRPTTTELYVP